MKLNDLESYTLNMTLCKLVPAPPFPPLPPIALTTINNGLTPLRSQAALGSPRFCGYRFCSTCPVTSKTLTSLPALISHEGRCERRRRRFLGRFRYDRARRCVCRYWLWCSARVAGLRWRRRMQTTTHCRSIQISSCGSFVV